VNRRIERYESRGDPAEAFDTAEDVHAPRERRPQRVEVLHLEPHFLVVAKPAGMHSVAERSGRRRTVVDEAWDLLRREDPAAEKPLTCHRLDRDTSGCLVLARDRATAREILRLFRDREVRKAYLALVLGAPQPPSGEISFRVAPDRSRPGAMRIVEKRGKQCLDAYETLETFRGLSLVRVMPKTGRTHEVRLALRSLGTPCAIDPLYGAADPILLSSFKRGYRKGRGRAELPLIDRLTLHAESIEFPHPGGSGTVRVVAAPPRDFAGTLNQLRRHAEPGSL
jgi:23S rRNA pseudouridine955/2504/2580 synthase/23S rRNA pseudouridine1911/1915/1917 synthase